MVLSEQVREIVLVKPAKYVTPSFFVSKFGENALDELYEKTRFLPENCRFTYRLYCVMHEIINNPICKTCSKELVFRLHDFSNFKNATYWSRFCNSKCQTNFKFDFVNGDLRFPDFAPLNEFEIKAIVSQNEINKIKWNYQLIRSIYEHLKGKVDCSRFTSNREAIMFIKNDLIDFPKCICGKYTKQKISQGSGNEYHKFCSISCSTNAENTLELKKKTTRKRYGVDNVFQSEEIKEKSKKTNIQKYGFDNHTKTDEYKKKYAHLLNNIKNYTQKSREINLHRKYDEFLLYTHVRPLFSKEEYKGGGYGCKSKIYPWQCLACGCKFDAQYHFMTPVRCPCVGASKPEAELANFVKKFGFQVIRNSRSIIKSEDETLLELDIYIPEKKLAIEFNGLHWHSEDVLGNDAKEYHLNKLKACERENIRLIQIWEDQMTFKKKIIFNRIKHALGLNKRRVYARNCEIKEIKAAVGAKFLNKYHIQGRDNSNITLGAFYKKRLVAVMTFGKPKLALGYKNCSNETFELSRFATIAHFTIVGIASKLLEHFKRTYDPKKIVTFADKCSSQGNVYEKIGFQRMHESPPNYSYLTRDKSKRIHRFMLRKSNMKKMFEKNVLEFFDESLTEWKNAKKNKLSRIYDCGNIVYHMNCR